MPRKKTTPDVPISLKYAHELLSEYLCDEEEYSVYFILCKRGQRVKIGATRGCAQARLEQLIGGSPFKLTMLGSIRAKHGAEALWHSVFKNYRVHREWYVYKNDLKKMIDLILTTQSCQKRPKNKKPVSPGTYGPRSKTMDRVLAALDAKEEAK